MFFDNCMIQIYQRKKTGDFDEYTGGEKEEYVLTSTIPADFQPNSPNESIQEFGRIEEDTYKLYINYDSDVDSDSIIKVVGEPYTYEVIGTPPKYNHFLNHIKLNVKRQRINTE